MALLALSNGLTGCLNVLFGRLIDKHACLEQILKSMLLVLSLIGPWRFACTKNSGILAIMFFVEVAAYKIFSTFMYRLMRNVFLEVVMGKVLECIKWQVLLLGLFLPRLLALLYNSLTFDALALLVVLMGCMKLVLFVKLFEFYKRHSRKVIRHSQKTEIKHYSWNDQPIFLIYADAASK